MYSRFQISKLKEKKTNKAFINKFEDFFRRHGHIVNLWHGIYRRLYFKDNVTQFNIVFYDHFCKVWEFEHPTSSPNFPQSIG